MYIFNNEWTRKIRRVKTINSQIYDHRQIKMDKKFTFNDKNLKR